MTVDPVAEPFHLRAFQPGEIERLRWQWMEMYYLTCSQETVAKLLEHHRQEQKE
jgi:hypothetical protein